MQQHLGVKHSLVDAKKVAKKWRYNTCSQAKNAWKERIFWIFHEIPPRYITSLVPLNIPPRPLSGYQWLLPVSTRNWQSNVIFWDGEYTQYLARVRFRQKISTLLCIPPKKVIPIHIMNSKHFLVHFWNECKKIPNTFFIGVIVLYRTIFSPTVGVLRFFPFYPRPSCVFYPTCSAYAITCFKQHSFFTAFRKTTHRIVRCHPGTPPQIDLP